MPYLPQTQDEHGAEPCFTLPPNFMMLGLRVLVHKAGRADQRFCLMRHLRWEDTFQMTASDRKGGVTEGVSTDSQHRHRQPCCVFTSAGQRADPWQRMQHRQDALEAYRLLSDRYYPSILQLQYQSPALTQNQVSTKIIKLES